MRKDHRRSTFRKFFHIWAKEIWAYNFLLAVCLPSCKLVQRWPVSTGQDSYTSLPYYRRKIIAKVRCSSHNLEIEKGRHKNQNRDKRFCLLCQERAIEDETHFLSSCQIYNTIRRTHGYATKSPQDIMNDDNQNNLSIFLSKCFRLREKMLKPK